VYAPGERGYITAADRAKTGIPIPATRIAELTALGERVGVEW
jgi:LDH2 family malate/lactate/ureidoglycolate dehydrogenase